MHADLNNKDLALLDPGLFNLIELENERQNRRLIMIPSESIAPAGIREALGSSFTNIYAEGYPRPETRWFSEDEILDYTNMIGTYRRYSDPRYYKGVEYVDVLEALARRRCAESFAANSISANDLYVNVQALSGAPANNAVYTALLSPGDTILGMSLLHGGHLTHGSSVNRSGKIYDAQHYTVDAETERLDYDAILAKAQATRPKIIIAGYTSYPWVPDWQKFREIADQVGAKLLADVSHIAGLIAAGLVPSPIGYAHITTFTTHKTMIGPRGACIITDNAILARKIDKAIFPGEQGGPHMNNIAGIAVAFKNAQTDEFKQLQQQIILNAAAFAEQLKERGLRVPYGGTDTHIVLIDCKSVKSEDGAYLSGDMGARILDAAGIVANSNTIPGDRSAFSSTGVRFGTTILTQRGFKESDLQWVADVIADLFEKTTPYNMPGRRSPKRRAKVDFNALENAKLAVKALVDKAENLIAFQEKHGYPHFFDIADNLDAPFAHFKLSGDQIRLFLNYALASDLEALREGESQPTLLHTPAGDVEGALYCDNPYAFILSVPGEKAGLVGAWLRDLSDAYIKFDEDLTMRLPGPMRIETTSFDPPESIEGDLFSDKKPYFIGMQMDHRAGDTLPAFTWDLEDSTELKQTPLHETHIQSGAKMVAFAGWDMPVWYSSVLEEHLAVRQSAGLFDVTHMGVYQAEGPDAGVFLDSVCTNDISTLLVGQSCYTQFLDQDANVIDDLLVYRRAPGKFLVVVNAANDEKDWAWLNAVRQGSVCVDKETPWATAFGRKVVLKNLRDTQAGPEQRVDIALQGPKSRDILLQLESSPEVQQAIQGLGWAELCEGTLAGIDLVVSRTGYTGERMGFELFVHPDDAVSLWEVLLKSGEEFGIKPCGLGARDSLRTEAGLPLYGHEMGGVLNLGVGQAGFRKFVKTYKPWFIGRNAYQQQEEKRNGEVIRFTFDEKRTRMAHLGDPVVDERGKVIGTVTSCAINTEGSLTGQAFVENKYTAEGTKLFIYQGSPKKAGKAPADLNTGDRVTLPARVTVISRFPR